MRFTYLAPLAALALIGCATTGSGPSWNDNTVSQLQVGMSKSDVLATFGEPTSKSASPDGEILTYKRPSDESGARNTYIAVVSLGGNTGANATVIDLLEITLANGSVADFKYSENVDNSYGFGGN